MKFNKLILGAIACLFLFGCTNDIDKIVSKKHKKCKKETICTIDFASAMNFEWDTMCFYSIANSLEDINKDLGFNLNKFTDTGDRLIFLNKGRFVYQYEFSYHPSKPPEGVFFLTDLNKFRISKSDAKFEIEKVDKAFFLRKI